MRSDQQRASAVRLVMRELFERCAAHQGLPVPGEVLPDERAVDPALLAELRDQVASFDVSTVEGFGYAYESLLQDVDRKHAGAHYTPVALAEEVVEHALAPLVAGRGAAEVKELRILDIATGSGIFLVSAARYLAQHGPSLGDVVTTCLYGADINPTTVEICRLSLWLLARDPTLALEHFDERVRCGDSLVEEERFADREPVSWRATVPSGFDAVIGNPPFLGVKNIRAAVGQEVRDHYARTLLEGSSGRSDLVVFFLARAAELSRDVVALVLPDAISEGDSARFGLGRVLEQGYTVYRAETSRPWPGAAGVRIALVWLCRNPTGPGGVLDGVAVERIGPSLGRRESPHSRREAVPAWMPPGHQATIVLGKSLVLTPDAAQDLIDADPRTAAWIRDYLSGDDLVGRPGSAASRKVLDLGSIDLDHLRSVPALSERLALVRAEREVQLARYPQLRERWWGFLNRVDRLYEALEGLSETIALAKHAKFIWPVLVPTGPVFSNGTIVYPTADRAVYALLASTPHRLWAVEQGGSRLNQSYRYNPSRLRATYPFPDGIANATAAGEQLAAAVAEAGTALDLGITDLLNKVHGPEPVPPVVQAVRQALVEVDHAVLAAHGISDRFEHAVSLVGDRTVFGPGPAGEALIKARLLG